jgi:hypothetical protein
MRTCAVHSAPALCRARTVRAVACSVTKRWSPGWRRSSTGCPRPAPALGLHGASRGRPAPCRTLFGVWVCVCAVMSYVVWCMLDVGLDVGSGVRSSEQIRWHLRRRCVRRTISRSKWCPNPKLYALYGARCMLQLPYPVRNGAERPVAGCMLHVACCMLQNYLPFQTVPGGVLVMGQVFPTPHGEHRTDSRSCGATHRCSFHRHTAKRSAQVTTKSCSAE